jgi:23S rRNA pseudouridine1911/1915/1917 synthase
MPHSTTPTPPVLYEDREVVAVDKPAGLVVHPAYKHPAGTLCDAIFARQALRGEGRPWLLHRLDRDTSGVVLFAKTERARRALVRQFERHSVRKLYLAVTQGTPAPDEGEVALPLLRDPTDRWRTIAHSDGQPARTRYRVLAAQAGAALVLAEPITGRTHQIRAHLAALGAPLAGDARYGGQQSALAPRAMLHAWRVACHAPGTGLPLVITAPLPPDMIVLLDTLKLSAGLDQLSASV